jgi:hypothetical protein
VVLEIFATRNAHTSLSVSFINLLNLENQKLASIPK